MNYYPLLLSIKDVLNDWNEKLDGIASKYMDNVGFGVVAIGVIFVVACWGISALNKK